MLYRLDFRLTVNKEEMDRKSDFFHAQTSLNFSLTVVLNQRISLRKVQFALRLIQILHDVCNSSIVALRLIHVINIEQREILMN